jgi:hypothetical protein
MIKKYNANGLNREGAAGLVVMAEFACMGTPRYPWSDEFKARVHAGLNGATSQLEIDDRIKAMTDEEFKAVEGRC